MPSLSNDTYSPWSPDFSQKLSLNGHTLRILPATISDTPEFVSVFFSIFKDDLIFRAMYGTANWDLVTARTIRQWREEWDVVEGARLRWFKVLNEDGKIVAIAKWGFPHTPSSTDVDISPPMSEDERIEGENKEIGDGWFKGLTENREKFLKPKDMYYMNTLAVLPKYQRMGVGFAIMGSVLSVADKEGRDCYVEASSTGLGLYRKCWFKEVGRLEIDCSGIVEGEETVFVTVPMIRDAGAGESGKDSE